MTLLITSAILFSVIMLANYLVKDYRKGIHYKGFIGKIQNLIKH
jgi:hypothetical protein